jgi:hypothetical protein
MPKSIVSPGKPGSPEFLADTRAAWIPLLVCLLSLPAIAQVAEQGVKLAGTDATGNSQQGLSVSLSSDGNTAIVGGPFDAFDSGASWIFARTGGVWIQQGNKLIGAGVVATNAPLQGWSVAISADGDTTVVGGIEDRAEYGSVWVFTRRNGIWTQQAKLADMPYQPGGEPGQGYSVALSARGDTALVGAAGYTDLCCSTAVFGYTRAGGVWTGPTALAGNAGEMLGPAVALSADGATAIMQVSTDTGASAAAVFVSNGGAWRRQVTLAPPAVIVNAVALSEDGNTALLGMPSDNGGIGAAWVFTRAQGVWSTPGSKLVARGLWEARGKAFLLRFPARAPWRLSAGRATMLTPGPRGYSSGTETRGTKSVTNSSGREPWAMRGRARPSPSPATVAPPWSAATTTIQV